jgi:hypothetical protein
MPYAPSVHGEQEDERPQESCCRCEIPHTLRMHLADSASVSAAYGNR